MNKLEELRRAAAENPGLLLFLGACPAMGASGDLKSALCLGLTVFVISVLSAAVITLLRRFMSSWGLLWAAVLLSAGFASMAQMLLEAIVPASYPAIGLYTAVCAVNLMIFSGAETGIKESCKAGLIFLAAIVLSAFIRELIGNASLWSYEITALAEYKIPIFVKAPGGFMVFAIVMAVFNAVVFKSGKERK